MKFKAIAVSASALSMVFSSGALAAEDDIGKIAAQAAKVARDVEFAMLEAELGVPSQPRSMRDFASKASPELAVAQAPRAKPAVGNAAPNRSDPIGDIIRANRSKPQIAVR